MSLTTYPQLIAASATPVPSWALNACCHQLFLNSGESATSLRGGLTPSTWLSNETNSLLAKTLIRDHASDLSLLAPLIIKVLTSRYVASLPPPGNVSGT